MILRCSLFSSFAEVLCSVCVPCTLLNKGAGVCRPNKWILAFKLWHLCGLGGVWVALLCSLGSTFVDGLFSVCPLCDLYAGWRGGAVCRRSWICSSQAMTIMRVAGRLNGPPLFSPFQFCGISKIGVFLLCRLYGGGGESDIVC